MDTTSVLRGRKVLITGAAGHIGAALCRRLIHDGAVVTGLVRQGTDDSRLADLHRRMTTAVLDLREDAELRRVLFEQRPDVVFHAAMGSAHGGASGLAPQSGDSIVATASLLDGLQSLPGDPPRLVHLSSYLLYGAAEKAHEEDELPMPDSQRGALKAASEMLVLQQALSGALPAVILRLFTVYGPHEKASRLVPTTIRAALKNEMLPLTEEIARRDYVFIDDVVEACLLAAARRHWRGQRFNVGSGRECSNRELVALVGETVGTKISLDEGAFPRRVTDRTHCRACTQRSASSLGWWAATPLAEGLAATVTWLRSQLELES